MGLYGKPLDQRACGIFSAALFLIALGRGHFTLPDAAHSGRDRGAWPFRKNRLPTPPPVQFSGGVGEEKDVCARRRKRRSRGSATSLANGQG